MLLIERQDERPLHSIEDIETLLTPPEINSGTGGVLAGAYAPTPNNMQNLRKERSKLVDAIMIIVASLLDLMKRLVGSRWKN
jgi:hypothetical protein